MELVHSMPALLLHFKKSNTKFDNNLKITLLLILISVLILKHDTGLSCFNKINAWFMTLFTQRYYLCRPNVHSTAMGYSTVKWRN